MKLKPLHDNVLVERIQEDEKTAGGIIIPDSAKEKPTRGKIVEVGEGSRDVTGKLIPLSVKKGDEVLFAKWGGTEIPAGGKELLIMKESDILAIVK